MDHAAPPRFPAQFTQPLWQSVNYRRTEIKANSFVLLFARLWHVIYKHNLFLIWLSFWTCHAVSESVLFTHFGVTPSTYDKQQGSMRNYKPLRPPLAMNPFCYRLVLCSSTRFPLFCVCTHCSKYVITVQIQSHLARQSRLAPYRLKQVQPTPCCHFRFLLLPCGITQLINQPCVKMLLRATNPNSQYDVRRWIHSNAVSGHFVLIA